ncbi:nematocyst expressed protein 4-like [Alosa alosa]|uniref:nematocyst expressed protein 4-like n=1 Tax=Alosa alosa TaxID=278164 RepID=UPI00201541AC|nr:nematocyst expressed protein 4-like [Alosa alosa]
MDPNDYPHQPWGAPPPPRDPGHYPSPPQPAYPHPHPHPHAGYPLRDGYPGQQGGDPRQADPGFYPPPPVHPRGPLRQDVPPSPPVPVRAPRYDTLNRAPPGTGGGGGGGYKQASPERYAYGDPRHKNAMTAAV